jgi:outer membrane lipoprotein LolB
MTALSRHLLVLLAATLLAACAMQPPATPPPQPPPQQRDPQQLWASHLRRVYAIEAWSASGKVAYRLPDDAGSANLRWRQQDEQSRLRLAGPLGAGTTEITSEGALLRVRQDGIERLYAADAAPWLPGAAPLPIPVDSIRHWLRGVPDPEQDIDRLVLDNALAQEIEQRGWSVRYEQFQTVRGLDLPRRMVLEAAEHDLRLTLILRDWTLP